MLQLINSTVNTERLRLLAGLSLRESKNDGFVTNIEDDTTSNEYFRKVLFTGPHLQLVVMSIAPGEDIGEETHKTGDQFIRIESGTGEFVIEGVSHPAKDGDSVVIPEGVKHNVVNVGDKPLKLYALYSPPEHKPKTVDKTKS
jgi:mannose-6-phosphate isomerase-like protein (cupin superfamily)